MLCVILALQGCFDPVYPQVDRENRIMEALNDRDNRVGPPTPLSPADAVVYALANSLEARVAEIEIAYQNEAAIAARRRLLPTLNLRYSAEHANHPSARWSESTRSGNQSLESSYSSDPNSRQAEVGVMWNVIDFGVGYLRARQQGERNRQSELQRRRVRQQIVLDVLSHYWRASAALAIANEAEALRRELDEQAESIRDSVAMRILSGAEGARRELAVQGGLAEMDGWRRSATGAKLELARVLGCGSATEFALQPFPANLAELPPAALRDPSALQTAALRRRPELYQHDSQERIAVDEARLALLQMAPNANLSFNLYDDPDKFLEWNNWMTVGARVSWNLFNIPARVSERRMAKLQGEIAKRKGLALAAGVMAQVGIAYSDWRLAQSFAETLIRRSEARERLVEALAAGEKDGQTRPGEVLQERVRLLSEKAAALRAAAEARVAGARLANAIGLDVDAQGRLVWEAENADRDLPVGRMVAGRHEIVQADDDARGMLPGTVSGLQVVGAGYFSGESIHEEDGEVVWSGEAIVEHAAPDPDKFEEEYRTAEMPEQIYRSMAELDEDDGLTDDESRLGAVFATPQSIGAAGGGEVVEDLGYVDEADGFTGYSETTHPVSSPVSRAFIPAPAGEDVWRGIHESYAKASPAGLVPKSAHPVREAEPEAESNLEPELETAAGAKYSLRPSSASDPMEEGETGPEELQSMAPPARYDRERSVALPKNAFRPNPASGALRPEKSVEVREVEDAPPPRAGRDSDARRMERQRALEPLQAIPKRTPLRPPSGATDGR